MKKHRYSMVVFLFLILQLVSAQDKELEFHAVSIGGGIIGSSSETSVGGVNATIDLSLIYNKSIFSVYANIGEELLLFKTADEEYRELSLLYGREYELTKNFFAEGHVGVGYFSHTLKVGSTNFEEKRTTTVGFPIRGKLVYYIIGGFGLGINGNINLNAEVTTYSGNLILQYKF